MNVIFVNFNRFILGKLYLKLVSMIHKKLIQKLNIKLFVRKYIIKI